MSEAALVYLEELSSITEQQCKGFFRGWPDPPSPSSLLKILKSSDHCVVAFDSRSGRVVGFVTCISDGILSAYIPLLEVLPEYQHRGIGTTLMERMLALTSHYYMTDLSCDTGMIPFYEKLGMTPATGMHRRNYIRQNAK